MIIANGENVVVDGRGITLMAELTGILRCFRERMGFPDDIIAMIVEVSKKSPEELHENTMSAMKGDTSAIEAMIHKVFGDKKPDFDKKPRTDEKKEEESHGEDK